MNADALVAVEANGGLAVEAAAQGSVAAGLEGGWLERVHQGAVCDQLE